MGDRLTQAGLEVLTGTLVATRATQLAVELFIPRTVPSRVTQVVLELVDAQPATVQVTQAIVELFLRIAPPRRTIKRLRRAPHVNHEEHRVFYHRFELDFERGQAAAVGPGSDPVVVLRFSRDGGQTWARSVVIPAGTIGTYTQRVLARRLGYARDMVFEITVTDPIAWSIVQAWLDLEVGQH